MLLDYGNAKILVLKEEIIEGFIIRQYDKQNIFCGRLNAVGCYQNQLMCFGLTVELFIKNVMAS